MSNTNYIEDIEDYNYNSDETSDYENRSIDYPDTPNSNEYSSQDEKETGPEYEYIYYESIHHDICMRDVQCDLCQQSKSGLHNRHATTLLSPQDLIYYDISMYKDYASQRLQSVCALYAPCKTHIVCVECVRKLSTEYLERTLRNSKAHQMACPMNCSHIYTREHMSFFLSPVELIYYSKMLLRYSNIHDTLHMNMNHYCWSIRQSEYFPSLCAMNRIDMKQLTLQVTHLLTSASPDTKCKECGYLMHKIVECNAMSHCGVEVCNICGYTDIDIPPSHWYSQENLGGCPRYDFEQIVQQECPDFVCREDKCFDESSACVNVDHKCGTLQFAHYRRMRQITYLLNSLPILVQKDLVCNWLPLYVLTRLRDLFNFDHLL